jgi:hypothetical protein
MHRLDPARCGVAGFEPERRVLLRESLNEWLRAKFTRISVNHIGVVTLIVLNA